MHHPETMFRNGTSPNANLMDNNFALNPDKNKIIFLKNFISVNNM
jgi:hypothetical protein